MSQIENNIPFQFPFTTAITGTNAFEGFDFSLKKTDSCDNFLSLANGINPLISLTQNKSIFAQNNNNNNMKAQNEFCQYPWSNHQQEHDNNVGNPFSEGNFGLNYVSSFPAMYENKIKHEHNEDAYDFMNLNQDDNYDHYDNISNPFNDDFLRNNNNNDHEFEQFKTNQSLFNPILQEQQKNQINLFDNQPQIQLQKPQQQANQTNDSQNSYGEANLLKMDDFNDFPEMVIEPYSEEEQRQIREENEKREREGQTKMSESDLFGGKYKKIVSGMMNNQKRRDYDKNICRYIARQMMRCFISEEYKEIILNRYCSKNEELYESIVPYIKSSIPTISGHRAFKDLLAIRKEEDNQVKEWKMVFRKFAKWFLRERSLRYIMLGNSEDKTQYIRFKNQVMLYFIDKPEKWNANLKINPNPFKVRNSAISEYNTNTNSSKQEYFQDTTTSSQEQF